jgi:hypothetical protein
MAARKFGNLGHHLQASAFEPDLARMDFSATAHGLPAQVQWLYGFLQTPEGKLYVPERKFIQTLTGGLFMATKEPGKFLDIEPVSGKGYRGELKRVKEPGHRRWHEPMYHRMPAAAIPEGEQGLVLDLTEERMTYQEGNILDLEGFNAGLGMQYYDSNSAEPLFYAGMCYWMQGEVMGERVEGPIFYDTMYVPTGIDWKEYVYFNELQCGWHVFANKYEDGTIEWGHLINGLEGFSPGVVMRGKDVVGATGDGQARFVLGENDLVTAMEYEIEGHRYVFSADETGYMETFSKSRAHTDNDYLAQYGTTEKVGEPLKLVQQATWLECFASRIRSAGRAVDSLPSQGGAAS